MLIFFKCSPGLCPREVRVVNCCPAHTLFHKGGYANSPYLTTLPTLPYQIAPELIAALSSRTKIVTKDC